MEATPPSSSLKQAIPELGRAHSLSILTVHSPRFSNGEKTGEVLLLSPNEVILRGKLLADDASPVDVEFVLHREGTTDMLAGLVRFLDQDIRVAAHAVRGKVEGGAIFLHETVPIWTRPTPLPFGREYKILAASDAASPAFTGRWSLGTRSGTLQLSIALPW